VVSAWVAGPVQIAVAQPGPEPSDLFNWLTPAFRSVAFEHDVFFPPANERAAADRIPGCEHVVIPDAALSTHPDEPVKHIIAFCTRVRTPSRPQTKARQTNPPLFG
jgi:pimeloyl-ACP methyl ester carboxylesterase